MQKSDAKMAVAAIAALRRLFLQFSQENYLPTNGEADQAADENADPVSVAAKWIKAHYENFKEKLWIILNGSPTDSQGDISAQVRGMPSR